MGTAVTPYQSLVIRRALKKRSCFLSPPVNGDLANAGATELVKGASGKVERTVRASRAGVGDGGLDGLAVVLDPNLLSAEARVHLSGVDCHD